MRLIAPGVSPPRRVQLATRDRSAGDDEHKRLSDTPSAVPREAMCRLPVGNGASGAHKCLVVPAH